MTGSTLFLVLISVVVVIVLAAWIVLVFYADAHPAWRRPGASAGHGPAAGLPEHSPARRAPGDADITAGKGHSSAHRELARRKADCGGQGTGTGGPELTTPLP